MSPHAPSSQHARPSSALASPSSPCAEPDTTHMPPPRVVMIVGAGRSGTNWLLDLLDLSPQTFCRNEPNEIAGGALASLPDPVLCPCDIDPQAWDRAIEAARLSMGYRDHRVIPPKRFTRPLTSPLGPLLKRRRVRAVLSSVYPSLRAGEWPAPAWLLRRDRLRDATLVMKLAQAPGWARWVLANRPDTLIVHIVRHPAGFLDSWRRRYLKRHDPERVRLANADRLHSLVSRDPAWAHRLRDIDAMSVDESELWYWLYAGEHIDAAGLDAPSRYHRVIYEDLCANPLAQTRALYHAARLPWGRALDARVAAISESSESIASAWRERLDEDAQRLVERILSTSPLRRFWHPSEPSAREHHADP